MSQNGINQIVIISETQYLEQRNVMGLGTNKYINSYVFLVY